MRGRVWFGGSGRHMLFRAGAAFLLLTSSGALLLAAYLARDTPFASSLSINLATEIFGIGVTVAIVEWLFERSRLQERGRQLAWHVLHRAEQTVWVWRGGPRRMGTDQLLGILSGVAPEPILEPITRSMLVSLATSSQQMLQRESAAVGSLRGFKDTLHDLTSLHLLEESSTASTLSMSTEVLCAAVRELAGLLDQPTTAIPGGLVRGLDPSADGQRVRAQVVTDGLEIGRLAPPPL